MATTRLLADSAHFTPQGRRLLVHLGAIQPDPLRVQAERWLLEHHGPQTPATNRLRSVLGPPPPERWLQIAKEMRGVK